MQMMGDFFVFFQTDFLLDSEKQSLIRTVKIK